MINCDKTVYRIVDYFSGDHLCCCVFVKALVQIGLKATIAEFNKLNLTVDVLKTIIVDKR